MLNIIQRLSGIATLTSKYVDIAGKYDVKVLDTRRQLPDCAYWRSSLLLQGGG